MLREGNAVFRIDPRARRLARIAGTGQTGFTGDGGPALTATFNGPKGIAYAPDQSLYIVDTENHAIRRVDLRSGTITTVLGTGQRGNGPDGDPLQCAHRPSARGGAAPRRTLCQRQRESLHSGCVRGRAGLRPANVVQAFRPASMQPLGLP